MIINFDDYRKIPVVYTAELNKLDGIARLHPSDHYHIDTYIPGENEFMNLINENRSILSENTVMKDDNDGYSNYLRNLYDEQRRIEISDDYERYCRQSWHNDENEIENKGE